ncbi:MAG TPA: ATP-binding cassette domain-containing protein, partial [Xylella taiwanensis]
GDLTPLAGERIAHSDLRIGYFAQHTVESLYEGQSPIDHFRRLSPEVSIQSLRDFLAKWNFPGDRAFESVDGFSGGERARLALSLIAWRQPNVLLLDEPTNHLDLEMREALAEALSDFDGAIVMVSHDRHLIGLVCDTFWRVADGVVEPFAGDLDEYAAWLRTRPAARGVRAKSTEVNQSRTAVAAKLTSSQVPVKRLANPQKLAAAERHVGELEAVLAELDSKLADPANYANGEVMMRLGDERERAAKRLAEAEQAWLLLMD